MMAIKCYSKQFEELCYKHLLYGQYKQQLTANWLNTTRQTRNWNICIDKKILTLDPQTSTSIHFPLQIIGAQDRKTNEFQFGYNIEQFVNEYPEIIKESNKLRNEYSNISEFQMESIKDCDDGLGYIMSSIAISILNVDGYYVGFGMDGMEQSENEETATMMFVMLNGLKHEEREHLDIESLMHCWDYTFNHLLPKSNLNLTDNVRIFEEFFKRYAIECSLDDTDDGHCKLMVEDNLFNLKSMEFDSNKEFYAINDIVIAEHEFVD